MYVLCVTQNDGHHSKCLFTSSCTWWMIMTASVYCRLMLWWNTQLRVRCWCFRKCLSCVCVTCSSGYRKRRVRETCVVPRGQSVCGRVSTFTKNSCPGVRRPRLQRFTHINSISVCVYICMCAEYTRAAQLDAHGVVFRACVIVSCGRVVT